MKPEFRRDPLHDTWVVFAPQRQQRPQDFAAAVLTADRLDPFAPGNERLTPPEVFALRTEKSKPNEEGWRRPRGGQSLSGGADRRQSRGQPRGYL